VSSNSADYSADYLGLKKGYFGTFKEGRIGEVGLVREK